MSNDQELEVFLRRFQPHAPAPLPRAPRRVSRWLALAALLLLATGLWLRQRLAPPAFPIAPATPASTRATWGALNALEESGPAALQAELERQARQGLPDVGRREGALRALAQFQKDL